MPFGVLATRPLPGEPIQITLVGTDGQVKAGTTAQPRTSFSCVGAGPILPAATVSTTDSRLYYLDGDTTVRFLSPHPNDLEKGDATRVPGGGQVASTFAVSRDDRRIAVVATDYSKSPPAFRIYVEDLAGGAHHSEIFSGTGEHGIPWAMGWHAGQLVLGYTAGCTQGGGPFSAFPGEYHVVNSETAVRSATLGSSSGCHAVTLPVPSGIGCADASGSYQVLGWDGRTLRSYPVIDGQYQVGLAPAGMALASCCEASGATTVQGIGFPPLHALGIGGAAVGWIDDLHLLIGAPDKQSQARIFVVGGAGTTIPVAAIGDFVARLPGGLDFGHGT